MNKADYIKQKIDTVQLVKSYGVKLQKSGNGFKGLCPFHDDHEPSFLIYPDTQRWKCFGCNEAGDVFNFVMKKEGVDFPKAFNILARKAGIDLTEGKKIRGGSSLSPKKARAHLHIAEGCNLDNYARKKKLPIEFLKQIGLQDIYYFGKSAIRIPYSGIDNQLLSIHIRVALEKSKEGDNRFRWRRGDKTCPYGLWRLNEARQKGYIVLVEGDSDCHTLWYHKEPAFGIPGASTWNDEWSEYLEGIPKIYTRIEPDKGGESLLEKLSESKIRESLYLIDLGDIKDPSELYLKDPEHFLENWQKAISEAVPLIEREKLRIAAKRRDAWELCKDVAQSINILDCFIRLLCQKGLVGEENTAKLLYLAFTSRILEKPVSVTVKGPSSAGKSFVVKKVLEFFPKSAYYEITAMSERAIAYSNESFRHKFIVLFEAAGLGSDFAQYLMRSLMTEGLIRYQLVEKTSKKMMPRIIEKEGPTGFITTTTKIHLHPENETRFFSVQVTDTMEQTKQIFQEIALDKEDNINLNAWHTFQEWMGYGGNKVKIPYAQTLAELIPPKAVRLRRDFGAMIRLIKIHTLLHQANRERDEQNRIIASLDDYAIVRELIKDPIAEGVEATVQETVRETIEAVRRLISEKEEKGGTAWVTIKELSIYLKLDRSTVARRVDNALCMGYLQNLEGRKGRPFRLIIGDSLPEEEEILPHPNKVKERLECVGLQKSVHIKNEIAYQEMSIKLDCKDGVCRCAKNQGTVYNPPAPHTKVFLSNGINHKPEGGGDGA